MERRSPPGAGRTHMFTTKTRDHTGTFHNSDRRSRLRAEGASRLHHGFGAVAPKFASAPANAGGRRASPTLADDNAERMREAERTQDALSLSADVAFIVTDVENQPIIGQLDPGRQACAGGSVREIVADMGEVGAPGR